MVSGTPIQVSETFKYDHVERLTFQTHQIGTEELVVPFQNIYDELGRLQQKRVGGKLSARAANQVAGNIEIPEGTVTMPNTPLESSFLQKVNYSYNIRGWLTGVNDVSNLQQLDQPKSLFAMKLSYNKLDNDTIKGVKKLFNGNIAEQTWRTAKADKTKRYGYAYDGFDRLKKATFQLPGTTQPISKAYNESLSYDSNGNILKLERFGKKQVSQGIELDDLTYTYEGNMLKKVVDATNNADGFKQGTHTGDDYTYDTFGNLKTDKNKGITNIKYNHLNLPVEITFGNGKIEYIYSAGGAKVQKKVTQGTVITTTDYLGGFQYTNNVLEFFPTPEGYYDAKNSRYVYQYSDHLGNTRLSYSDINKNGLVESNEILSEADYYPFGLQHTENSIATTANKAAEKYQYNAKEFQDELNLNVFDYGARNYDAAIGRWFNHDPLSEVTLDPYGYTYNNPINLIDPTGMSAEDSKGGGWFSRAWSAVKNTFSLSSEADDMNILDEIVISTTGQSKEERVEQKQFNQVLSNIKQEQTIEEWRNIGVWDDNISYDNRAHALGSQLTLAMPSARFNGLFGLFSKSKQTTKTVEGIISKTLRVQKQVDEHIVGGSRLGTNSYLNSVEDATSVLNASHSGKVKVLSTNIGQNRAYVQYNSVTGYYNNNGVITSTNKFLIKGSKSSTVVPIHPNSTTFK